MQIQLLPNSAKTDVEAGSMSEQKSDRTSASTTEPDPLLAHSNDDEPLEAIEESRPDDLDEFAESAGPREKSIDVEELSESPEGNVLREDGEIDWTTQAD
jgi:hypothetical protein